MKNKMISFLIPFVLILGFSLETFAEKNKPLLETKILFQDSGNAKISYKTHGFSDKDTTNHKIQSALLFYAYTMHQLNDQQRLDLMNQVQRSVGRIASDAGLQRADLLKKNPILSQQGKNLKAKGFDLSFEKIPAQGNTLEVTPMKDSVGLMSPAVFYYFQDLTAKLPEDGVRIMVLAMGGMNKYYREVGKASDPNSISAAPTYGLNIAIDIISKLAGKEI